MKNVLKSLLYKFRQQKIVRKGNCKKCGQCCRAIMFKTGKEFISNAEVFEKLKRWQPRYKHFYISGQDSDGALLFTCKSLGEDNLCKSHHIRSLSCRFYPLFKKEVPLEEQTLPECGYYFEPTIEFTNI